LSMWKELNETNLELNDYLKTSFSNLLNNNNLFEWIDSHVERGFPPATYTIIEQLKKYSLN